MTSERANILKILNARKLSRQSITLADLINETGLVQYGTVEKILKGLKQDGYISLLIVRDPLEPITYDLTERGCNYHLEIEAEQQRIAAAEEAEKKHQDEIKKQHIHDFIVATFSVVLTLLVSNFHRIVDFFKGLVS